MTVSNQQTVAKWIYILTILTHLLLHYTSAA